MVLGYAPFYVFLIPVVALAGLFKLVLLQSTARQAALVAFCFGLGKFGTGVAWIYVSLHVYGGMSAVLAIVFTAAFCAFLALFVALFGTLAWYVRGVRPAIFIFTLASLWVASEWLRGVLLTGFPWLAVGYSQVADSPLFGYAPIIGVYGISGLVAATAAAVWRPTAGAFSAKLRIVAFWCLVWMGGALLAKVPWTAPFEAPFEVSLLQGNVSQDKKWQEDEAAITLATYLSLLKKSKGKLIVMPETALPMISDELPTNYVTSVASLMKSRQADLIVGIIERARDSHHVRLYNSAINIGISSPQVYRKKHLVPFGEYIPAKPLFGWVLNFLQIPLTDLSPGPAISQPLDLQGTKVGINICFEDAFGEEIITAIPDTTLLVNMSNLAWFGDTNALPQHLQIGQMRAAEAGRYMLSVANTGITAIINERGQILLQAPSRQVFVLSGSVQKFTGTTPYAYFGNMPILLFSMLGVSFSLRQGWKRGRRSMRKGRPGMSSNSGQSRFDLASAPSTATIN